jgi:multiple sugar transport system ATP-binding protein
MSMADIIAVMNQGVIEQFGTPQEIYDRPATLFVADFIGSPAMNLIPFTGRVARGARAIDLNGTKVPVPELAEGNGEIEFVLGARPEHVSFDDGSQFRGEVFGTEYLGTMQIVTVKTAHGQIKARVPAHVAMKTGETVGLSFMGDRLSLFERKNGRALKTALHREVVHG